MAAYRAPLRDMKFVLQELHDFESTRALPGCGEFSFELAESILREAAKLSERVLHPLNRKGDEKGCVLENGVVRTPKGFAAAYRAFADGGWSSLACDPEFGGQGLPHAIRTLVEEMICSANLSFASYIMLIPGAYAALSGHGAASLKRLYLPKLVSGAWTATMCLTESQSGSDLNLLRARAAPQQDGSYRINGSKIFISAGEHDLVENIIHLVLARLPDAPEGTRGISLFVVPKMLLDAEDRPVTRNGVFCSALEQKMGQNASATCALEFEDAVGWLVGEPHRGLRAMFAMMNTVRMGAGVQGLGIAEAAYQGAVDYARERRQGRSPAGVRDPDQPADPLIVHPDVRRMVLTMRAYAEGMRALGHWIARALDRRERHPDAAVRAEADQFVSLMTPVAKAMFTDLGSECANLGVQVLGGHGYIRAQGMEQYVRDVRITQIYDGTNGIQALDLVTRKLQDGRVVQRFFDPAQAFVDAETEPSVAEYVKPFADALARLREVTDWIVEVARSDREEAAAAATDYLRLFGLVGLAYVWSRTATLSLPRIDGEEGAFYRAKLGTARFFLDRLLPQHEALARAVLAGGESMRAFEESAF